MKLELINEKPCKFKFFLINIIGVLTCLKNGIVTIDEAEGFVFTPYVVEMLGHGGVDPCVIDLIYEGLELEDYESLIPDKLPKKIEKMLQKAIKLLEKETEKLEYQPWYQIILEKGDVSDERFSIDNYFTTVYDEDEEFEEFSGHKNTDE